MIGTSKGFSQNGHSHVPKQFQRFFLLDLEMTGESKIRKEEPGNEQTGKKNGPYEI